jgi:hypothetical protein
LCECTPELVMKTFKQCSSILVSELHVKDSNVLVTL